MESSQFHHALAVLDWQVELGATDAICDAPVNCYELPQTLAKPKAAPSPGVAGHAPGPAAQIDPVDEAKRRAAAAVDLDGLREALAGFEHCALKKGARNLVFSDGIPGAPVMIVGSKKVPPSAWALPPASTLPPLSTASAMCSATLSTAAALISGPSCAPSLRPSPRYSISPIAPASSIEISSLRMSC